MYFKFKNIGHIVCKAITEFMLQKKESYNLGDNDVAFSKASKVYECYLNENLVAFIILTYCFKTNEEIEDNYFYEIIFGKLTNDENVKFKEILKQFLQNEYKEDLKIFAVVKNTNKDKDKVFNILEENGFVTTENPSERIFIPNNNCQ